jgi:hypothetical protein
LDIRYEFDLLGRLGFFSVVTESCCMARVLSIEGSGSTCALDPFRLRRLVRSFKKNGRGDRIRTCDLFTPSEARYQAALRPDAVPCGGRFLPETRVLARSFHEMMPQSCDPALLMENTAHSRRQNFQPRAFYRYSL